VRTARICDPPVAVEREDDAPLALILIAPDALATDLDFDVADDAILFVEAADEVDLDDADPLPVRGASALPYADANAVDLDEADPEPFISSDVDPADRDREIAIAEADALNKAVAVALLFEDATPEQFTETLPVADAIDREVADPEPEIADPDICDRKRIKSI